MVNRSTKKYGDRPGGFEPPAVHAGKTNKALLPVYEFWAVTINKYNSVLERSQVNQGGFL